MDRRSLLIQLGTYQIDGVCGNIFLKEKSHFYEEGQNSTRSDEALEISAQPQWWCHCRLGSSRLSAYALTALPFFIV